MKPTPDPRQNAAVNAVKRIVDNFRRSVIGAEVVSLIDARHVIQRLDTGATHWRALQQTITRRIDSLISSLRDVCSERGC